MFEDIDIKLSMQQEGEAFPMFSINDDDSDMADDKYADELPLLALKNTVLFPGLVIPITVGRSKSKKALKAAEKSDKMLAVVSQKDTDVEDPELTDLYRVGTVAKIIKVLKMPDGSITAILQGRQPFNLDAIVRDEPYPAVSITVLTTKPATDKLGFEATISSIRDKAKQIIELSPNIPTEATMMLQNMKNDNFLLSFISSNLNLTVAKKQNLLEETDPTKKAETILAQMDSELQMLELKSEIESKVRGDIQQQQKEYFLNQQLNR